MQLSDSGNKGWSEGGAERRDARLNNAMAARGQVAADIRKAENEVKNSSASRK